MRYGEGKKTIKNENETLDYPFNYNDKNSNNINANNNTQLPVAIRSDKAMNAKRNNDYIALGYTNNIIRNVATDNQRFT